MKPLRLLNFSLTLMIAFGSQFSRAEINIEGGLGGHLLAEVEGRQIALPTLKTEITADLQGDLATITVRQVFANPTRIPMNATYLFPLNKDAAVHAMQMQVGDMLVEAVIAKREAARQTFETAKKAGKAAALLEQHRPNMFTQEIANLMPGMPVTITLTYSQAVPRGR
jgi:Ca-activated chloride channel family protein